MLNEENVRSLTYKIDLDFKNDNDARLIGYSFIQPNTSVLDVGCACGDFGSILKKNKNCTVVGFEYDQGSIEIAKETKCYENIFQIDLNIFAPECFRDYYGKFDYIVLLDVLEHLIWPERVMGSMKYFLKENGCYIISLPNIAHCSIKANLLLNDFTYTKMGILDKTHLRFFTYKSILHFFEKLQIEIQDIGVTINILDDMVNIPAGLKRYLSKSVHSYVVQYISKCNISKKTPLELSDHNTDLISIKWSSISERVKRFKIELFKKKFFPKNSLRSKFVKKVKMIIKGN